MHVTGLMHSADNLIELAVSCPQIFSSMEKLMILRFYTKHWIVRGRPFQCQVCFFFFFYFLPWKLQYLIQCLWKEKRTWPVGANISDVTGNHKGHSLHENWHHFHFADKFLSFLWFDKTTGRNVTGMWVAVSWGGALRDKTKMAARETTKNLVAPPVPVSIALTYFYWTGRESRAKRTSIACIFRQQISDVPDRQWPLTAVRWVWRYIVNSQNVLSILCCETSTVKPL